MQRGSYFCKVVAVVGLVGNSLFFTSVYSPESTVSIYNYNNNNNNGDQSMKVTHNSEGLFFEQKVESSNNATTEYMAIQAPSSFQWEDIDFDKPIFCGVHKCFYFDRKNVSNGYLVLKPGKETLANVMRAWESVK